MSTPRPESISGNAAAGTAATDYDTLPADTLPADTLPADMRKRETISTDSTRTETDHSVPSRPTPGRTDLPADDQPPAALAPDGHVPAGPGGDEPAAHPAAPTWRAVVHRYRGLLPGLAAVLVAAAYLLAPRMGQDLSAQMARADFARHYPLTPVDLRWFGGILPFGYSSWTPPVMALVGPRLTAAIATVIAVIAFHLLLKRGGAPRPVLAGVIASVTFASNLTEGRTTFACGMAVGLLGLLCISRGWRFGAAVCALLAGLASPVAALFVGLAAGAFLLRRRVGDALYLGVPAALSLVATSVLFADSGRALVSDSDALRALLVTAVVFFVVPRRQVLLRIGVALGFVMMAVAWQVPSPVGANATRLSLLFAVPLVAAYVRPGLWTAPLRPFAGRAVKIVAVGAVVAVAIVQPPLVFGTMMRAGGPETSAQYYDPLVQQIQERGLNGRVEVPELIGHWEAAYLTRQIPLARGWLRQTDTKLNQGVFYGTEPTADTYLTFLQRNAVQYVAVATAKATFAGRPEVRLIGGGLPYLRPVWANENWTLYAVKDPVPLVSEPAVLRSEQPDRIVLTVPTAGDITVRMRWWRWLTVQGPDGACLQRPDTGTEADGGSDDDADNVVVLHVTQPGRYTVSSQLSWTSDACR